MINCAYNPFSIAIRLMLFFTSCGISRASFELSLHSLIKTSEKILEPIVGNQPILCYINCPMFGLQSLLSTVCYCIHKGII